MTTPEPTDRHGRARAGPGPLRPADPPSGHHHARPAPRRGMALDPGGGGDPPQRRRPHRRGQAPGQRGARVRGHRPAPARERLAGRARRDPARRARPGQDPHHPLAGRPARRMATRSWPTPRSTTTPSIPCRGSPRTSWPRRGTTCRWPGSHRSDRYGEKLATPDTSIADLIGEVDPIKVAEGRYLSDELTIHYGLVPAAQPGHLRRQRAPRPGRAHPGGAAQRARGARRPDPRPPGAPPARHRAGGHGQPGGLHQPRADHHAPEGPVRGPDPHPLPAGRRHRAPHRRARGRAARTGRPFRDRRRIAGRSSGGGARRSWPRSWPSSASWPARARISTSVRGSRSA